METFLQGDLDTVSLLAAFIVALLTKRIVPWWIYDEVVQKLKAYETAAPELITQIKDLMDIINQEEADKMVEDKPISRTIVINKQQKRK